ncbi:MAG: type I-U CRISPR-associated protein Cas8c [Spirochaetaceae bacterium]|nr:type I-U CRISPR-associated protein Cas8c [Spirochaetaceae bacterium]
MAESATPVDVLNPGQVFACLGIVEAVEVLLGHGAGVFDWANGRFRVTASGPEAPVARVLQFLVEAELVTRAPARTAHVRRWKKGWGAVPELDHPGRPFPYPDPPSPATLPVVLRNAEHAEIAVDYWGDATNRDNVKFWAGAAGYPGAALLRDAQDLIREGIRTHGWRRLLTDPFGLPAAQTSSFRFDWRRDYLPVEAGFSPNAHKRISMVGYPVVEMLAAIGVSHARPRRSTKLEYRYGILGGFEPLDVVFLRAALGAATPPLPGIPFRRFVMRLGWPGRENQARCIAQVAEVSPDD